MANTVNNYFRLFPKFRNQITETEVSTVLSLLSNLRDWWSTYFIPDSKTYFDLCVQSKTVFDYLIENKTILDSFHIWILYSDSGGLHDFIGFKSTSYKIDSIVKSDFINYKSCSENWDYFSSNPQISDEIRIFSTTDSFDQIFSLLYAYYRKPNYFNENIHERVWKCKMQFIYYSNNYLDLEEELQFGGTKYINIFETEKVKYPFHEMRHALCEDSLFTFEKSFLENRPGFAKCNESISKIIVNNIEKIEFLFQNKIVHEFKWNENEKQYAERDFDPWHNSADIEYRSFLKWYYQ